AGLNDVAFDGSRYLVGDAAGLGVDGGPGGVELAGEGGVGGGDLGEVGGEGVDFGGVGGGAGGGGEGGGGFFPVRELGFDKVVQGADGLAGKRGGDRHEDGLGHGFTVATGVSVRGREANVCSNAAGFSCHEKE